MTFPGVWRPFQRPRSAQDRPKSFPESLRERFWGAQERPIPPQSVQESKKGGPGSSRRAPGRPKGSKNRAKIAFWSENVDFLKIVVFLKENL